MAAECQQIGAITADCYNIIAYNQNDSYTNSDCRWVYTAGMNWIGLKVDLLLSA